MNVRVKQRRHNASFVWWKLGGLLYRFSIISKDCQASSIGLGYRCHFVHCEEVLFDRAGNGLRGRHESV